MSDKNEMESEIAEIENRLRTEKWLALLAVTLSLISIVLVVAL